jgi:hypothetical protein
MVQTTRDLYLRPVNPNSYRHKPAEHEGYCGKITGVVVLGTIGGHDWRKCYKITYCDGFVDYVAFQSIENGEYEFIATGL